MELFLSAERLAVGYGDKPLLEGICLKVRKGEILTLIGPNGAGKSTILKTLARQLAPVKGAVYLDGASLWQMDEKKLAQTLAILTTERVEPERMTCEDVVSTGRYPYTGRLGLLTAQDRRVVADCLKQVQAAELAGLPFACISDGQRQRVLLARALCQQPQVLLLDEPTSFLDIRHKLKLLDILKNLVRQRQLAVVMSLHELDLAQKISDTVLCVQGEGIESCGAPEAVFTPEHIRRLYQLEAGSYNALFGSVELARVQGAAKVFVIGGGGSGIPVYRRLQREGVPFAAGILQANDLDWPVAKTLAVQLVEEAAYEPVGEQTFRQAAAALEQCDRVICTLPGFGTQNAANRALWEQARQSGKPCEWLAPDGKDRLLP